MTQKNGSRHEAVGEFHGDHDLTLLTLKLYPVTSLDAFSSRVVRMQQGLIAISERTTDTSSCLRAGIVMFQPSPHEQRVGERIVGSLRGNCGFHHDREKPTTRDWHGPRPWVIGGRARPLNAGRCFGQATMTDATEEHGRSAGNFSKDIGGILRRPLSPHAAGDDGDDGNVGTSLFGRIDQRVVGVDP